MTVFSVAPLALFSEIVFFGPTVASSLGATGFGGGGGGGGGFPATNSRRIWLECGSQTTV